MSALRRVNLSAAIIVLICFFLPWVQVSCAGATDSMSGFDLARNGRAVLWLIPVLICALLLLALLRAVTMNPIAYGIASLACGAISLFLMNRERMRFGDNAGVISARLTGWFWLDLFASLAVAISGLLILAGRRRWPNSEGRERT